jgi:hypothetical protein
LLLAGHAAAQVGSIRGVVYDKDFEAPLAGVQVTNVETGRSVTTSDQGNYELGDMKPGRYTLVFAREGYVQQLRSDVTVAAGRATEIDVWLIGDFTDLDEFVVQDVLELGGSSEAALLQLRFDSPALLDSIGAELMSRAGASDAASALRLVAGATVKDGKSAVIRGLPDRYVSSQINGVRLPSADEDKRAVELDQFPAAVIESLQVSKTFTPDQQGDASGGAVDVRLRSVPTEEFFFRYKAEVKHDTQLTGRSRFLSYDGGGVSFWGRDDGRRDIQSDRLGGNWDGAVGVSSAAAPELYKWSTAIGRMTEIGPGVKLGGSASFFYERDGTFSDRETSDSYWVEKPGGPMTPRTFQGLVGNGDFKTGLFDVTRSEQSVQWGGLASVGLQSERHSLNLNYLYTKTTEDTATLAEDTRGKQFFFPGYDPDDPSSPGHDREDAAPYLRLETLEYTERTATTLQLNGRHSLPLAFWFFEDPELEWSAARSAAFLDQPDKRQFGSLWKPARLIIPDTHYGYKPDANFNLGNLQRIWKRIEEDSEQYSADLSLPFEQWGGDRAYLKFGYFDDQVDRTFDQDTFSNFGDNSSFAAPWEQRWSGSFGFQDHPITDSKFDVDYVGDLDVSAWYAMAEVPLVQDIVLVGGVRVESTKIGVVNIPESDALWFPPDGDQLEDLDPGEADVRFSESNALPALALEITPLERVTLRLSYSETVARQTFKELTPVVQQEFLGGPIFIGNPDLRLARLRNYDVRLDYTPNDDGLLSVSWFHKDIDDAIEYVQRVFDFSFTTAVNYPDGRLTGWELEGRQGLGHLWEPLEVLAIGANATFIDSEVTLPADEAAGFDSPAIQAPMSRRDATGAPEALYNLYLTFDLPQSGTRAGLFYTLTGDTLIAGAGQANGNFVPNVYADDFETLNLTMSQDIGHGTRIEFKAKNITNPRIETVYRSVYIGDDLVRTSSRKGIELSIGIGGEITF